MHERTAAGHQKPANGQLCLNYLSHSRGQAQSDGVVGDELTHYMADFKAYMNVEYTPGGWYRST